MYFGDFMVLEGILVFSIVSEIFWYFWRFL
jgi:hypothetical protein